MNQTAVPVFYSFLSIANIRANCCSYQYEHTADCQGFGAPTITVKQSSICGPNFLLLFAQNEHPTLGASVSAVQITNVLGGLGPAKRGQHSAERNLANNFKLMFSNAKGANKQQPSEFNII